MMTEKPSPSKNNKTQRLFPEDLPVRQWIEFAAAGYHDPVSGANFTAEQPPCCGAPLGGLGTGCLDIDPRGIFGFSSLFNPGSLHKEWKNWRYPRKNPAVHPFLGLSLGDKVWVLADKKMGSGEAIDWCTEPQMQRTENGIKLAETEHVVTPHLEDVSFADAIDYWGHYPIVDMEYQTSAPVSVGLRTWAPFILGDEAASNTPAVIFEVHLRNASAEVQSGRLAFSFPGPDAEEARSTWFNRKEIHEDFSAVLVSSPQKVQYLVGVLDHLPVHFGAGLCGDSQAWSKIGVTLPQPNYREENGETIYQDGSSSMGIDFSIEPGKEKVYHLLLCWYAPIIEGAKKTWEGFESINGPFMRTHWLGPESVGQTHFFTHMYASRFDSALDIARYMSAHHVGFLKRIIAWQSEIYQDKSLPAWLRDALVNNLCTIAEDSYWFQPKAPLGDSVFPLGAFGLNESPRGCPHMACIPCDWYGNLPIVFFFPDLAYSTLILFKQYQKENGEIPFCIGKIADLPDMATPEFHWQVSLNSMCFIDMVDRLWLSTGDDTILEEFYESVKRANTFTMNLNTDPGGPISMAKEGGMEWFEFGDWAGMAAHLGGLRLAELQIAERMAERMGDHDYVERCQAWFDEGSSAMENELWTGSYYLNFLDKETGRKSDEVMGYQLDGEWTARFHGLPGVFRPERVNIALETIRRCNIAVTPDIGAVNFARPDGVDVAPDAKILAYGRYAMFVPEMLLLSMTYLYDGQKDFGIELLRKFWENLCLKQGHAWDLPNNIHGDTGKRVFGTDYYQNMMLWAFPSVLHHEDLQTTMLPGSLIDRILEAGEDQA